MKKVILPLVAMALVLTACVPSLHPLYTAETMVFREELIGIWKEKPQEEEGWTFSKGENNVFSVTISEKEESSKFEGRLVKLGETLFLDLFPSNEPINQAKLGLLYRSSLIPGHLILKVKLGAKLELQMLEPDKLKEFLAASPKALAHTELEKDYLVLTASTEELQAFMKKHANSTELWGEATVLSRLML